MEKGICAICHIPTRSTRYFSVRAEGSLFHYQRCSVCGLVFLDPQPGPEELLGYYGRSYYGRGEQKFAGGIEALRFAFARTRVSRLQKFLPRSGRALDIGCGQGTFLQLLRGKGWEVQGTELTEEPARRARQAGIPVFLGEIQEGKFGEETLDLVTLWHVIEHLREPSTVVERIRLVLKDRGIVAISTPNIESLQARIFREKWFHLDPPRHLYLFSPDTLQRLMAQAGFRLIRVSHFSMEQNPYGWLQSSLNRLTASEGSLYTLLKSQAGDYRRRIEPAMAIHLLLSLGLMPTCLFLAFLLGWMKREGTMEAYFKKEDGLRKQG